MNLLIVDDEIYVVRAIKNNLQWDEIGIANVFTAFNAEKAKNILKENKIDIIITDIEMPKESGLELMNWIRENGFACKGICLTCHAEFSYAQEALRLGYLEYLVKPVDFLSLQQLIKKIVDIIEMECIRNEREKNGKLWDSERKMIEHNFWEKIVIHGEKSGHPEMIVRTAEEKKIEYQFDQELLLFLFAIKKVESRNKEWEENRELMEFIMSNIARDSFLKEMDEVRTGWKDDCMWTVIPNDRDLIMDEIQDYIEICEKIVGVKPVVYISEPCFGETLFQQYKKLKELDCNNITIMQGIVSSKKKQIPHEIQNKNQIWESMIDIVHRAFEETNLSEDISLLIEKLKNTDMNKQQLFLTIQNVLYEMEKEMKINHIHWDEFWIEKIRTLYLESFLSIEIAGEWIEESVKQIRKLRQSQTKEHRVIMQARRFIENHIVEKIAREDIAGAVNYSCDYLSRIFKKEMGISLGEYMIQRKVEKAKELIDQGEENIGTIAAELGYNSFSYFTEIFKRQTGYLPRDYKKRNDTEI